MKRSLRVWAATGFAAVLAFQILSAEQGPDVGPNGENGGYTATFVDVKGIRTRFYEEGSGEPMLLVHGSGFAGTASANTWVPVLGLLAKRFHVYAPDKLASGMTDNPKKRRRSQHPRRGPAHGQLYRDDEVGQGASHRPVARRRARVSAGGQSPNLVKTLVIVDSSTAASRRIIRCTCLPGQGHPDQSRVLHRESFDAGYDYYRMAVDHATIKDAGEKNRPVQVGESILVTEKGAVRLGTRAIVPIATHQSPPGADSPAWQRVSGLPAAAVVPGGGRGRSTCPPPGQRLGWSSGS